MFTDSDVTYLRQQSPFGDTYQVLKNEFTS